MFSNPFPNHIAFSCQSTELPLSSPNHPEEENLTKKILSESRKLQFLAGRSCAREALSKLGIRKQPILWDSQTHEPLWPNGFCGSITHSGIWAAAAAAKKSNVLGLGIDIEYLKRKVDPNIRKHVCVKDELLWLESLEKDTADKALKLIFSAKESIFKAYFPPTRVNLYFHNAKVTLNKSLENFEYELIIKNENFSSGNICGNGQIQTIRGFSLTSVTYNLIPSKI